MSNDEDATPGTPRPEESRATPAVEAVTEQFVEPATLVALTVREERKFAPIESAPKSVVSLDSGLSNMDFAERYSVERLLGEGGMGTVNLCADRQIGRRVAMKVLREGRREWDFSPTPVCYSTFPS